MILLAITACARGPDSWALLTDNVSPNIVSVHGQYRFVYTIRSNAKEKLSKRLHFRFRFGEDAALAESGSKPGCNPRVVRPCETRSERSFDQLVSLNAGERRLFSVPIGGLAAGSDCRLARLCWGSAEVSFANRDGTAPKQSVTWSRGQVGDPRALVLDLST